jgi:[ribosomal protein S18]-alanine N-acetyltransferase
MRLLADTTEAHLLASLHAQCFLDAWSAESIAALLATPGTFAGVSEEGCGFVMIRVAGDESEVLSLGVTPAARRRGTATVLVLDAADVAASRGAVWMFLEVDRTNLPAIALYKRLGFAEVGCRAGYYEDVHGRKSDALVLRVGIPLLRVGNPMQLG